MSWKRQVNIVQPNRLSRSLLQRDQDSAIGSTTNQSSILPEVYSGHPQRIDRYSQYEQMDQDVDINNALDTIADFSTQRDETQPGKLFKVNYNEEPSDTELKIINECLQQWSRINEFKKRLWRMFRSTLMYGDQFFIRDPDTFKWMWVAQDQVEKVLVNEEEGKKIVAYVIRDLDINLNSLTATQTTQYGANIMGTGTNTLENNLTPNRFGNVGRNGRFDEGNQNLTAVDAKDVIQLSLSEGLDAGWPFATSILESVYKVYRQKELLEDAILIYRIQRAPERRIFYIDVGDVPANRAAQQIERFKNEFRQRMLPSRSGQGQSVVDASYNPLSTIEDIWLPVTPGGRGSKVETLAGGANLGEITDLKYFSQRLLRGLRIPASYVPYTTEEPTGQFNDGRVGTSYIQEFRFAEYCKRLQRMLAPTFDEEFKIFIREKGFDIDSSLFELDFNDPQHFGDYERAEKDVAMINTFTPLIDVKFISKRTLLKRYLGWSDDEITQNEIYWKQENLDTLKAALGASTATDASGGMGGGDMDQPGLDAVGIRDDSSMGEEDAANDGTNDTGSDQMGDDNSSPISGEEGTGMGEI